MICHRAHDTILRVLEKKCNTSNSRQVLHFFLESARGLAACAVDILADDGIPAVCGPLPVPADALAVPPHTIQSQEGRSHKEAHEDEGALRGRHGGAVRIGFRTVGLLRGNRRPGSRRTFGGPDVSGMLAGVPVAMRYLRPVTPSRLSGVRRVDST